MKIPFNLCNVDGDKAITLIIDGVTHTVRGSNARFEEIMTALRERNWDVVPELVNLAIQIEKKSGGLFTVDGDNVLIDGNTIPKTLGDKIVALSEEGLPFEPFIEFWKNLRTNPSNNSIKCLFDFLDHNHVPITEDGCFIAYKGVREDFTDCYTGTIDNSPGKIVNMPRNQVDDNPHHTCSNGLHVAGWDYASGTAYGGAARYLMCKVNPANVVSVPPDYDFQKMRVCEYEVLKEVDKPANIKVAYVSSTGDEYRYEEDDVDYDNDDDDDYYYRNYHDDDDGTYDYED